MTECRAISLIQVGAGEVFFDKYCDAFVELQDQVRLNRIKIFDIKDPLQVCESLYKTRLKNATYSKLRFGTEDELAEALKKESQNSCCVVISSPTITHVPFAVRALMAGYKVALEKPLASTQHDFQRISSYVHLNGQRKLFLFGYYMREKALPLLLLANKGGTQSQLSFVDGISASDWRFLIDELGLIKRVKGIIIEGEDTRSWVYNSENGGQSLETFSHLITLSLLFCKNMEVEFAELFIDPKARGYVTSETGVYAILTSSSGARVQLVMLKFAPPELRQRWMVLEFERGIARMDFEKESLEIHTGEKKYIVMLKKHTKNFVQMTQMLEYIDVPNNTYSIEMAIRSAVLSLLVRRIGLSAGIRSTDAQNLLKNLIVREFFNTDPFV